MEIDLFNQQTDFLLDEKKVIALVREVVHFEGKSAHEVSVHFLSLKAMCNLHDDYFDDPSPTDCISFPSDEDDVEMPWRSLGDVFVCPAVAPEAADKHNTPLNEEISLYVIHGLLHLMGYNDIEDEEREKMRDAEQRHLANLREKGLLQIEEEN